MADPIGCGRRPLFDYTSFWLENQPTGTYLSQEEDGNSWKNYSTPCNILHFFLQCHMSPQKEKANVFSMGSGTPIVMLHSAMSSKLQWYFLMRNLSDRFQTVAVDLYGSGESPFPPPAIQDSFSLSDEIALVNSLLDGLVQPGQGFHLVGHSYGGATALRLAYGEPGRVLSLTLFEPVAYHLLPESDPGLDEVQRVAGAMNEFVQQGNDIEAARFFIDYWNGTGTFASYPQEMKEYLATGAKKMPLGYLALLNEPLSLEDYRSISVPVCLMAGKQSPISSRRVAELLPDYLPDCRIHWLNAGHMAPISHPEKVNPIIETFIRQYRG